MIDSGGPGGRGVVRRRRWSITVNIDDKFGYDQSAYLTDKNIFFIIKDLKK